MGGHDLHYQKHTRGILSNTMNGNLVLWVYLNRSQHFLGRAYRKGLNMACLMAYWEKSNPYYGCALLWDGTTKTGCMRCHHTIHTTYWKFSMTYLTSHTRQRLLSKASTDVSRPVTTKLGSLQSRNQDHRPWEWSEIWGVVSCCSGQILGVAAIDFSFKHLYYHLTKAYEQCVSWKYT